MANSSGNFSVLTTFELLRRRKEEHQWRNKVWIIEGSFKINFLMWRSMKV